MSTALLHAAYKGPDHLEARFAEQRAREAGLSSLRARVVGNISSFRDGWIYRKQLAEFVKCSVRTVQRAITQARAEGLLDTAFGKPGEKPPGWKQAEPPPNKWTHRWTIGRGMAKAACVAAIAAAKIAHIMAPVLPTKKATKKVIAPAPATHRRWTAEEIDAELAAREHPPPVERPPPDV